jgi:hypothetical protein
MRRDQPVDGEEKTFENARLFVRTDVGDWKLLGLGERPSVAVSADAGGGLTWVADCI